MEHSNDTAPETLIISEAQLVLAEKRTSLAAMRTGIAVFVLPISVFSFLIATSRYYDFFKVLHLIIPVLAISFAFVVLGSYLIVRALFRIRQQDRVLKELKRGHSKLAAFMD